MPFGVGVGIGTFRAGKILQMVNFTGAYNKHINLPSLPATIPFNTLAEK